MKTKILIAAFALLVANVGKSQLAFGVSPGLSMNSAYFGYKMNKIVPFIGFQYAGTSFNYEYSYQEFDYDLLQIVNREINVSASTRIMMPNIGVKYFFMEKDKLKAHGTINIAKPILSGKVDSGDNDTDDLIENTFEGVSVWGGELSVGAEYFFDEHFSLGGEFGLRYLRVGFETSDETTIYNPMTDEFVPSQTNYKANFNASPTFSKISLNFYF